MYFSEVIKGIGYGGWIFNEFLFAIDTKHFKIGFSYSSEAEIIVGKLRKRFDLTDIDRFTFVRVKKGKTAMYFGETELFRAEKSKMKEYETLFSMLLFLKDEISSPCYEIKSALDTWPVNFCELVKCKKGLLSMLKIIFFYKERFSELMKNSVLKDECTILFFMEDKSGKVDFYKTLKKNLLSLEIFTRQFWREARHCFLKREETSDSSTGKSDFISSSPFLILTDKNVIFSLKDGYREYSAEDAFSFKVKSDKYLAGILELYDGRGERLMEKISKHDWDILKNRIWRLKKASY